MTDPDWQFDCDPEPSLWLVTLPAIIGLGTLAIFAAILWSQW